MELGSISKQYTASRADHSEGMRTVRVPRSWAVPLVLCLLFGSVAIPVIFGGTGNSRAASDQNRFHLVVIRQFASEWPNLNFRDYISATTPGYHVVVAAAARYLSGDLRFLRLVGLLFTIGLIATFGAALSRRVPFGMAVALALPLLCSSYIFTSAPGSYRITPAGGDCSPLSWLRSIGATIGSVTWALAFSWSLRC